MSCRQPQAALEAKRGAFRYGKRLFCYNIFIMSPNLTLYNLMKDGQLTSKDVCRRTHISRLVLYLYLHGYLSFSAKNKKRLAECFNTLPAVFDDGLNYPSDLPRLKESKGMEKIQKICAKWKTIIIVSALLLLSMAAVISGSALLNFEETKTKGFYQDEFIAFVNDARSRGNYSEDEGKYTLAYTDSSLNVLTSSVSESDTYLNYTSLAFSFPDDNFTLTLPQTASSEMTFFIEYSIDETDYVGYGAIENGSFKIDHALVNILQYVDDESLLQPAQNLLDKHASDFEKLYQAYKAGAAAALPNTLLLLLQMEAEGNRIKAGYTQTGDNLLLFGAIAGCIFAFADALCLVIHYAVKKKGQIKELMPEFPEVSVKNIQPLKPNWKIQPFLPETFIRLLGVAFLLAYSILLFQIVHKITLAEDFFSLLNILSDVVNFVQIMPYLPLATLILFYMKIEVMQSKDNIMPQILTFFFFGLLYYVAENMFSFYLSKTTDFYYTSLLAVMTAVLPGNLFWGIGCFSLIYMFLLTTPSFASNKKKIIIWRSLVALPFLYLLGSYIYSVGVKLWSWNQLPSLVEGLLYRKQFNMTAFAILYPLCIFFYQKYARSKYGKDNAELFFNGNKYFFMKNLFASVIIGLLALVNYLMKATPYGKALDMNKSYWICALIPLALIYHPHMGQRSFIWDNLFNIIYGVSFSFAYVYLAKLLLFI